MLAAGVPYVLVGGIQFYQRAEVKDCLAYLRLLYNQDDKVSETRVLKLGKQRYTDFRAFSRQVNQTMKTRELLDGVIRATRYLEKFDQKDPEDQVRIENVKELLSVAEAYPHLGNFLEQVTLVERETLQQKETRDGVVLMTLHAAKGLEFKQVFLVGLEEGLLPHSRSMEKLEDLEEERRLMYVGVTRAMDELVLSYARSRLVFGARGVAVPSRFIGEIGEERLERI